MKKALGVISICAVLAVGLWLPATAQAGGVIKIGAMATLEGAFAGEHYRFVNIIEGRHRAN